MSVSETTRHRWPWVALAVVMIVLVLSVPLAWRFRPLNSTESRLAGQWTFENDRMLFSTDRRFSMHAIVKNKTHTATGEWSYVDDRLIITHDLKPSLFRLLRLGSNQSPPSRFILTFDGDDRLNMSSPGLENAGYWSRTPIDR